MKIVTIIVRVLLGLMFVVFGLNGFLHFIPMPPPDDSVAQKFAGILPGAVAALLECFLIWRYWPNFAGLLRQGT